MTEEIIDDVEIQEEPKELTLREELEGAMKEAKERQVDEPVKAEKANKAEKVVKESISEPKAEEPAKPSISAPNTWTAAAKSEWDKIPPHIQAEIAKRESEVEKGFTKLDEERSVGKTFKEVISPYLPMIQAEGGTPITAIQSLLNTAYVMRTAPQEQKTQLFLQLAQQYGVNLNQVSQPQTKIDPQLQAIQQELAQLKYARQSELSEREQQQQAGLQQTISTFAADPKNVHFEAVKADMAALLQGGRAKDLQEAYDMAVWARPDIRSTLLEAEKSQAEAKRVAEIKAKAEAARKASVSLSGSPGATASSKANGKDLSLREELEQQFAALRNA